MPKRKNAPNAAVADAEPDFDVAGRTFAFVGKSNPELKVSATQHLDVPRIISFVNSSVICSVSCLTLLNYASTIPQERIVSLGGTIASGSGLTNAVQVVFADEPTAATTKLLQAKQRGLQIYSYDEAWEKVGRGNDAGAAAVAAPATKPTKAAKTAAPAKPAAAAAETAANAAAATKKPAAVAAAAAPIEPVGGAGHAAVDAVAVPRPRPGADATHAFAAAADEVTLVCVKEGSKLRVRILTPGYYTRANCQFPRDIRVDGRQYSVPRSDVAIAVGKGGMYFYRIGFKHIKILDGEASALAAGGKINVAKVFKVDEECVVCMSSPVQKILVPCGHMCMCAACDALMKSQASLGKYICMICRSHIVASITEDQME
jgi:hypothetical protein